MLNRISFFTLVSTALLILSVVVIILVYKNPSTQQTNKEMPDTIEKDISTSIEDGVTWQENVTIRSWPNYFSTSRNNLPVWAETLRRTVSATDVANMLPESSIILTMGRNICGALGSGRIQSEVDEFTTMIKKDDGVTYRSCLKDEAVSALRTQTNDHKLYWHIGNEINSKHFGETMGDTGHAFDTSMIPDFAEYFVAPTVQALNEVSLEADTEVFTVLGSIVSGHNENSRAWLDELLNYEIQGNYAPDLAGKKVYEVIDYVSFHYTIGANNWENSFDDIARWIGQGNIKGIIDTEEIGSQSMIAGIAQYQSMQGFARLMSWVDKHGYTSDQVRLNYWAQGSDSPDEAMTIIYDFFGDTAIKNIPVPSPQNQTGSVEAYALSNMDETKQLFAFFTDRNNTASWKALLLPSDKVKNVTLYHFTSETNSFIKQTLSPNQLLNTPVSLSSFEAVIYLVNTDEESTETNNVTEYDQSQDSSNNQSTRALKDKSESTTFTENSVGYLGCSITVNAIEGYHSLNGKTLWQGEIGEFGGGGISAWSDLTSTSNLYWQGFTELLETHPRTSTIWIELCTSARRAEYDTYDNLLAIRNQILSLIPNATIYVSAQPDYLDGHVCGIAGNDGPMKMQSFVDQLVASGLAEQGPIIGPLTKSQTTDGCHANKEGKDLMGRQLKEFFGG